MTEPKNKEKPISRASAPKLRRKSHQGPADGIPVRVEFGADSSTGVTSLRTPEPLPPSPAAPDAEGWFDHAPTNPASIPDLGALADGESDSLPPWALTGASPVDRTETVPKEPARSVRNTRWLTVLLAATCLAVGMVLGALLQSRLGPGAKAGKPAVECPDPAAHAKTRK